MQSFLWEKATLKGLSALDTSVSKDNLFNPRPTSQHFINPLNYVTMVQLFEFF